MKRRDFLTTATSFSITAAWPGASFAQQRKFAPAQGRWRTFEVVTRLDVAGARGLTQAWVPLPSLDTGWQASGSGAWTGNWRSAALASDAGGARMVHARFESGEQAPWIEVTTVIRTQDRHHDWKRPHATTEDRASQALYLQPTDLLPTDGIVASTARSIVGSRKGDVDKVRAIYDWVVANSYREPKVRGCGIGDIKAMLETGNLGGKCADINALFVGLARASGVPARDVYGIRVAPSAFGYKELGAGSSNITGAQHCRAEAWLEGHGWVAMDPADVCKVMRQETAEWIKDPAHPVVAPVYAGLFGAWEGNWIAYNVAHDIALPGSRAARIGFLMYPQAETGGERVDSLDPNTFRYAIRVREITA